MNWTIPCSSVRRAISSAVQPSADSSSSLCSMVAAMLLIAGYTINDKIVVFDRIREELKLNPTGTLRDIASAAAPSRAFSFGNSRPRAAKAARNQ